MSREDNDKKLFLTIKGMHELEKMNEDTVYEKKGDLAIILSNAVKLDELMGTYESYAYVTRHDLEKWNLDESEAFSIACKNTKEQFPGVVEPISQYITFSDEFLEADGEMVPKLYVVTNKEHFNGTVTIFTEPDVLDHLSTESDIGKVAIVPISSNSMVCCPLINNDSLNDLSDIYNDFLSYLKRDIGLAQGIMTYDSESKTICSTNGEEFDLTIRQDSAVVFRNVR